MIKKFLQNLYNGKIDYSKYNIISLEALRLIREEKLNKEDLDICKDILDISNILYNNSDKDILPLDDGVYDLLLELYRKYNPNIPIGAKPVNFQSSNEGLGSIEHVNPMRYIPEKFKEDFLFYEELDDANKLTLKDIATNPMRMRSNISRRVTDTKHVYPKLVGSLDKCKFVMNYQAEEKGVLDDDNVKIVERDFFGKHIKDGTLDPNRRFTMVFELKYDGASAEAECSREVESARTRGDANEDIGADITPMLKGYVFPYSTLDETIGIKFEAIMTYTNLYKYNLERGYNYKNCRTAISGLFSSSDGAYYRQYITLVPLETSIEDIDRVTEIEFLNKNFYSGVKLHYTAVSGTYKEILFQLKRFVEEAELKRDYMSFMYDGVVISYLDEDLRKTLGRKNSINQYSVAVKFNPLKKSTIFLGYTYTVGQDGMITPMVHYQPVEFFGTIHPNSSLHSYRRVNELQLKLGDIIDVEYVNDVMPYVTKPDNSYNAENTNPVIEFISNCPSCGTLLEVSKSQKSIKCPNMNCDGRKLARVVNMFQKLNLKDFSDEYLKNINVYHLSELMNLTIDSVRFLGPLNSQKFMDRLEELRTKDIYDYEIIGALGFNNIAKESWRLILNKFTLDELLYIDNDTLYNNLIQIKGIGKSKIETIIDELPIFMEDLLYIVKMNNVIKSKGAISGKSIRFTGFRNKELVEKLSDMGFDVDDNAGVTKTTDILLIPDPGHQSSKVSKALSYGVQVIPVNTFLENIEKWR